ncbi:MAG: fused MFS/spermidine synthase [Planctomycetota bacterium]
MEKKEAVPNLGRSRSLIVPCATVFISSFCIMVLELVAGRMLARFLGSSLYTWTSVIGVVLGGITIGNYIGGRLADRFKPGKTLAVLFGISALCCVLTVVLNNIMGRWMWLWGFNWPVRTLLHVSFVFLLPSTILGTISPVVAKMALARGLPVGRTVGDIYAWGAVGSIAGTFATGYYLIALMGTIHIVWAVGAAMAVMALLYGARMWMLRGITVVFAVFAFLGTVPWGWADTLGEKLRLRAKELPGVIYEDETQYCYVAVKTQGGDPEKRIFVQDILTHSAIVMGDLSELEYSYEQIMAAVTDRFARDNKTPSFLIMGGGGYVFPRYLKEKWPDSVVDVAEIDPGVTNAAVKAFGLDPDADINSITLDARNYIDGLIAQESMGRQSKKYDFIYEDALDHYSVPFQLTTREFNEKIARVLNDDGIYMIELIDTAESGLFLGAMLNTLKLTFPFVTVISERNVKIEDRNTFVVIAAKRELKLDGVCEEADAGEDVWYFQNADMEMFAQKSGNMILTDDYAPVEHLLAPVIRRDTQDAIERRTKLIARRIAKKAEDFAWKGNLEKTLETVDQLAQTDPNVVLKAYKVMALIFGDNKRTNEAISVYRTAIEKCADKASPIEMADLLYDFATFLAKADKMTEAYEQLDLAAKAYHDIIGQEPESVEAHLKLGEIALIKDDSQQAVANFRKAAELAPSNLEGHNKLIQIYDRLGQFDNAIEAAKKAVEAMLQADNKQDAEKLRQYIQFLEFKKSRQKQQ